MPLIFIGIGLKWLLRFIMLGVYAVIGYLQLTGTPVLQWLFYEHPWWSTGLFILSIILFVAPFFMFFGVTIKKKNRDGGEVEMRKLTIIVFVIIGAVAVIGFIDPVRNAVVSFMTTSVISPVGNVIVSTVSNFMATPIYQVYGLPIGLIGGCFLTLLIAWVVWPRAKSKLQKKPTREHLGAPPVVPVVIPTPTIPTPAPTKTVAPTVPQTPATPTYEDESEA